MTARRSEGDLLRNVVPKHYNLEITTDLQGKKFEGKVETRIVLNQEEKAIALHAVGLDIKSVTIKHSSSNDPEAGQWEKGKEESVILKFKKSIPASKDATLTIEYRADLQDEEMQGYYLGKWDNDGKDAYAISYFQPNSARRAFPCWDEIDQKSTFSIKMISRDGTVNLSNMDVAKEYAVPDRKGWKATEFKPSPLMSTYLVAFANGKFDRKKDMCRLKGGEIPLSVYVADSKVETAKYALQVTKDVLPIYEQMFDVRFPLPKLDTLIADALDTGAMENWGLIIGRDAFFCVDGSKGPSILKKREVTTFVCHEVSHMWFGDLTTPKSWQYVYLNEGFATLIGEVYGIEKLLRHNKLNDPTWDVRSTFINEHIERAFATDAKLASHAIDIPNMADEQRFDDLSYKKGAAVLLMLSEFIGKDVFFAGVSKYLKHHEFKNATSADLWDNINRALQEALKAHKDKPKVDVSEMMKNWISKQGFPYVRVDEDESKNSITVRQNRFLSQGQADAQENTTTWHIPLQIATKGADGKRTVKNELLTDRETKIQLDLNQPFKLNSDATGFYRVHYSPKRLEHIRKEISGAGSIFSIQDRIGLLDDAFALAYAGIGDIKEALSLLRDLPKDLNYAFWKCIEARIADLKLLFSDDETIGHLLEKFCKSLYDPLLENLKRKNRESDPLYTVALLGAADNGGQAAVDKLQGFFNSYIKDGSAIQPDLQEATYVTVGKYSSDQKATYDRLRNLYEKEKNRYAIFGACATQDSEKLQDTLKAIFTGKIDRSYVFFFVEGLARNPKARRRIVDYFESHYDRFMKYLTGDSLTLEWVIRAAFRKLSTQEDYRKAKEIFQGKDVKSFEYALNQTLEDIRLKIGQRSRVKKSVMEWLKDWDKPQSPEQQAPRTEDKLEESKKVEKGKKAESVPKPKVSEQGERSKSKAPGAKTTAMKKEEKTERKATGDSPNKPAPKDSKLSGRK